MLLNDIKNVLIEFHGTNSGEIKIIGATIFFELVL